VFISTTMIPIMRTSLIFMRRTSLTVRDRPERKYISCRNEKCVSLRGGGNRGLASGRGSARGISPGARVCWAALCASGRVPDTAACPPRRLAGGG
jgi:hypothetical protein